MRNPNTFIVGAPKCGTTALSEYLRTHSNVYMSKPKEPHFFASDIEPYSCCKGLDEYLALFEQADAQHSVIAEASVLYLYSDSAIRNIYTFDPKAKLIVMLRNPVDYIYSYHSQLLLNADEDIEDFESAWRYQTLRRQGKNIPNSCRVQKLLYYQMVAALGEQVDRLLSVFPANQVHFILFDDLVAKPQSIYREVLNFLELEYDGKVDFPVINENQINRFRVLGKLRNSPPETIIYWVKKVKAFLGLEAVSFLKTVHKLNRVKARRKPLSKIFKKELSDAFVKDLDLLERLIQKDLSLWKNQDNSDDRAQLR